MKHGKSGPFGDSLLLEAARSGIFEIPADGDDQKYHETLWLDPIFKAIAAGSLKTGWSVNRTIDSTMAN
tara:strand:+ start:23615 stop:23821 length:207 start_codon:yes stop_codon:yes gene_type:complete